ncbi:MULTISPECIES: outer membrane lipid asymmetry maintenance protein MlaD [Gammaproteobacteria]|uniref:outer membrane lipid asymmetry maintenance protein MlaD n=1 Tax=Gammaproteobacteria TaxID=1236 RepID=UPI001ADBC5FC|nr:MULTISPECIES: outer membrane lipid asymmetry maintenance protein MlaD [Gammaproteobacteria]MBO9484423.1 outer membrane lipid asymmetry maintenance protein MlaD [Salinisphaera sp. G21_0]MBO9494586.1 outer membrane lipid asymmetry maintenance protein MlaD [Thalassotalea sp. G20_0]
MRIRTLEISVGAFMLAGMLALVLLAVKVSGLSLKAGGETYELNAYFDNIGALKPRSKISMAGVTIGKVKSVELDKETYMARVVMDIDQQIDNIPIDSTASIVTAGLLGEQYISISIGGDEAFLRDGERFEDTQSALIIEELIGKFLLGTVNKSE